MFALSSTAVNSTALLPPPASLAQPASDLVSTRLTAVALPAPLANTKLANEPPTNRPTVNPAAEETVAQANGAPATSTGTVNSGSGPSSAFLAQLISQSNSQEDSQIALTSSFSRFAPALQYNALVGYGVVKYRPSNAGLPSADAPVAATSEEVAGGLSSVLASVRQAYANTQSRNQAPSDEPQLTLAG